MILAKGKHQEKNYSIKIVYYLFLARWSGADLHF